MNAENIEASELATLANEIERKEEVMNDERMENQLFHETLDINDDLHSVNRDENDFYYNLNAEHENDR